MASTPHLAACSANLAERAVVGVPTCMMFLILPCAWSTAISAMRRFSSSSSKTLSPVPPASQNPCTPAWMLNSITCRNTSSFNCPSAVIGVIMAG